MRRAPWRTPCSSLSNIAGNLEDDILSIPTKQPSKFLPAQVALPYLDLQIKRTARGHAASKPDCLEIYSNQSQLPHNSLLPTTAPRGTIRQEKFAYKSYFPTKVLVPSTHWVKHSNSYRKGFPRRKSEKEDCTRVQNWEPKGLYP